jgi:methyltransferase family protein
MLWCEALQCRGQGVTHFAMMHTDIMLPIYWLDILIEEMDRVDADIMTGIVSIKDDRKITTTGIRYPGVWGTRRFSVYEINRLPETFSIADTDEPDQILAINTGCWVCRLPEHGWPDKFPGFHNKHKIEWAGGIPEPWFDSEDWLFSDWAASQGLKVYATRKLFTSHQGAMFYDNRVGGNWETELQRPTRPLTAPIPDPQITIETDFPIAAESFDHTNPLGTRIDSTASPAFNKKLFEIIPSIRLLDLGCSGGALVRSILDDGGFAIGIEGSDYSLKRRRAEWGVIPNHLFTADVTKPFTLANCTTDPVRFNVITAWEFWEHIAEQDIAEVVENIHRHTTNESLFIGSISQSIEPHHQTVKPKQWWIDRFQSLGWIWAPWLEKRFDMDVPRGSGPEPENISYSVVFRIR